MVMFVLALASIINSRFQGKSLLSTSPSLGVYFDALSMITFIAAKTSADNASGFWVLIKF